MSNEPGYRFFLFFWARSKLGSRTHITLCFISHSESIRDSSSDISRIIQNGERGNAHIHTEKKERREREREKKKSSSPSIAQKPNMKLSSQPELRRRSPTEFPFPLETLSEQLEQYYTGISAERPCAMSSCSIVALSVRPVSDDMLPDLDDL